MKDRLGTTGQQRLLRASGVRQALASVELEGLYAGDEARHIFQRYADGELTLREMGTEIEALHDREFGPVLLSGDTRT